jgi:microcystin degradation protein MlrC
MKIVIAQMSHETNTFSPVPTPLSRFSRFAGGRSVPLEGQDACDAFRGTASCMGGFIQVCEDAGAEIRIPVAAAAPPSGPVENAAFEYVAEKILNEISGECDGLMLDLHGAMVTETYEDGEGELLKRIKNVAPDLPIAVPLDMHANLYEEMVRFADVITGYHTYPHVDGFEAAERAGSILIKAIRGEVKPVTVWNNLPMLPHVMRQGTDDSPNRELQQRAREMEQQGALAASLFTGFPHADIANAGLSAVVVTDGDIARAEAFRDELLDMAWKERASFVYRLEPLHLSVERAKTLGEEGGDRPVIILDHYDNTASGGTMDTTEVLAEVIRQGLSDVAVFAIYDPGAVEDMAAAGVGNRVALDIGGNLKMPAITGQSRPIRVEGVVKLISDGRYRITGPMGRGIVMSMGTTAVLDTGDVEIVVISRHVEPNDPGCLTSVGIVPLHKRFLMLKSRIHYRAGFRDIARAVVECAGCGVCTSDYNELTFEKVRRPIFPLDTEGFED